MERFYFLHLLHLIIIIGLIFCAVLLIIRYYFNLKKQLIQPKESREEEKKIILPLRFQAYERIILFLERISPGNIVMRLNQPDLTALQLQTLLIKTIREEFEYNFSQQIYISPVAWEMVKNAKEEIIKLINQASGKVIENAPSGELVRNIFELALETERLPVTKAIDDIKMEVQKLF